MTGCGVCAELERIERGEHPWAVARTATGYVWLNRTQHFEGATFFAAAACVREVHDLDVDDRSAHLVEMSEVGAAVHAAFAADKMNHEALGNAVPHLHWWLTPRRSTDPRPRAPIWEDLDFLRIHWTGGSQVADDHRLDLRRRLLRALEARPLTIERVFV